MIENAKEKLEFIQPHDVSRPELTELEKVKAAGAFKNLCDDLFLANMDKVENYNLTGDQRQASLRLKYNTPDGSYLSIEVKQIEQGESKLPPSCIFVEEYNCDRRAVGHHYYRLSKDGMEVTRQDSDYKKQIPIETGQSLEEIEEEDGDFPVRPNDAIEQIEQIKRTLADTRNSIENQKLEKQIGINDQPVGIVEINQIATIIKIATPYNPNK